MRSMPLRWMLLLGLGVATTVAAVPALREQAILSLRSVAEPLIARGDSTDAPFDAFYQVMVEALPLQQRAEAVLQHVVNQRSGAAEYLIEHAASWSGSLKRNPRWDALWLAARNSPRIEARLAALELHLAEAAIGKQPDAVDRMMRSVRANPTDPAWGYFNLGALGARGVERERVLAFLEAGLAHAEAGHREQAVEALALFGGAEVIAPLLTLAAEEPNDRVRERALCALASSGVLHLAERYLAVPGLIALADRPGLQANTRGWVFQALREISGVYGPPDEVAAWRPQLREIGLLQ